MQNLLPNCLYICGNANNKISVKQCMLTLKIIAVILAVAGIIGSIVPALPGPPLGWAAMLCVFFCNGSNGAGEPMTLACLLIWLGITITITVLDYIVVSVSALT